jgi:hypothetical protein
MSGGDGAHQPQLAAEGLAEILLALERVERDEDLTYEGHSPFCCKVLYSMLCGGSDSEFQPSLVKHAA